MPTEELPIDELLTIIQKRRSIRKYTTDPVTKQQLEKIIEAARWAPCGANSQPWEFIAITEPKTRKKLANVFIDWRKNFKKENEDVRVTDKDYLLNVPAFIVVLADPRRDPQTRSEMRKIRHTIDNYILLSGMGAAIENMMLAITSMGLGSVWLTTDIVGIEEGIREVLKIPPELLVLTVLPVGKPAGVPRPRPKRELEEVLHWERLDKSRLKGDDARRDAVDAGRAFREAVALEDKEG